MLFRIKNSKKQPQKQKDPQISPLVDEPWDELPPQTADDGISLSDYAAHSGISEAEVWRRIKRGEIVARPLNGKLLIWNETPQEAHSQKEHTSGLALPNDPPTNPSPKSAKPLTDALPPIPEDSEIETSTLRTPTSSMQESAPLPKSGAGIPTTELALIIDHLSLAKDENRDILSLTQDSIRKITELSDVLIATKDALLEAKEFQIEALKERLTRREKEINNLKKANEDLEILASTITAQSGHAAPAAINTHTSDH